MCLCNVYMLYVSMYLRIYVSMYVNRQRSAMRRNALRAPVRPAWPRAARRPAAQGKQRSAPRQKAGRKVIVPGNPFCVADPVFICTSMV